MSDQKLQSTDLLLVNRGAASHNKAYGEVKSNILDSHVIQAPNTPNPPDLSSYPDLVAGTIWINTSEQPPVLNIWDPSANGGLGGWEEAGGSVKPINPDPTTDIVNPPGTTGSGTKTDPFDLTNAAGIDEVLFGEGCASADITFNNQREGAIVSFVDENAAANGARFAQPIAIIDGTGSWTGKIVFADAPPSTISDLVYSGLLKVGTSEVYYKYDVKVKDPAVEPYPSEIDFGGGGGVAVPPVTGSGSQADPFVLPCKTSYQVGGSVSSTSFTVTNQSSGQFFTVETLAGGVRFDQPQNVIQTDGTCTLTLEYTDAPNSTSGQTYDADFKLGTTYFKWCVVQVVNSTAILGPDGSTAAPNASPEGATDSSQNLYGTGTGTWADNDGTLRAVAAPAGTRNSRASTYNVTDGILFDVNGTNHTATDKAIVAGDTLSVIFDSAKVTAAAQGDRIAGALTNDNGYFQVFEMVKDGEAQPFTISPLVDQALSTAVESGNINLKGFNVPVQLTYANGADPLTDVEVSVNGAAYTATFPATLNPGDTVQLKGTTTSVTSLAHTIDVSVGGETATWSVTTTSVAPTISQPSITSPTDESDHLGTSITLQSTAFTATNGAGSHASSSWEVYEADLNYVQTDEIVSIEADSLSPTATMHGLRFDSTRNTKLSRTGSGTGTISYWKKDASTGWEWEHEHQEGAAYPDVIGAGYDGYMSDYYFVDGQDLPAETFVAQFDGAVGPLDSSEVLAKIAGGSGNYDQKWSDNVSGVFKDNRPATNAFDGDESTHATSPTPTDNQVTEATFLFNPPIPSGKLEMLGEAQIGFTNNSQYRARLKINNIDRTREVFNIDANSASNDTAPKAWYTLIARDDADINSVTVSSANTGSNYDGISAYGFKANGKLLIDGPANTSQVWSSAITAPQGMINPTQGFNGDTTNSVNGNGNGSTLLFTPETPISYTTSVRIWVPSQTNVTLNTDTPIPTGSVGQWYTLATGSGVINTIDVTGTVDGAAWNAIEVDGEILIDGGSFGENGFYLPFDPATTNPGKDESGQNNNLKAIGFNTSSGITSWSGRLGTTYDTGFQENIDRGRGQAFDGRTDTYAQTKENGESILFRPEYTPLTGTVRVRPHPSTPSNEYDIADGTGSQQFPTSSSVWSGPLEVDRCTYLYLKNKNGGTTSTLAAIELNGQILTDGQTFITDFVSDTPVNNYPVLENGKNGNLVATAAGTNLTYVGETGTDYYYEADGVGVVHPGGTPFSSGNGKAYNFGQQPFVATFNDAQTWSDFLTPENGWLNADNEADKAFNGNANVSSVTSGNGDTMTFTYTLTNVDSISLWLERTNDVTVTDTNDVSHTFRTPALSGAKPGGEFTITKADLTAQGLSNNIKSISWFIVDLGGGTGGNTQLYALEVNGETLVDPGLTPDQSVTLNQPFGSNEYIVEFDTDENLSAMSVGHEMQQVGGTAKAKPIDVNSSNKTMTFDVLPPFAVGDKLQDNDIDPTAPDKPTTDIPDPLIFTSFASSTDDAVNLTTYALTPTANKAYYSRVSYKDDTTPDAIESESSPWHQFSTET